MSAFLEDAVADIIREQTIAVRRETVAACKAVLCSIHAHSVLNEVLLPGFKENVIVAMDEWLKQQEAR